ncbi:hypothetical protein [Nocardia brevicatena]|uniref:hypothetical protein n=1 Tax=Nocardia brevicatena TaxID=37327 RepID=UPI0003048968|nr:hypothetical protein [Nocardia brevicatena]
MLVDNDPGEGKLIEFDVLPANLVVFHTVVDITHVIRGLAPRSTPPFSAAARQPGHSDRKPR